MKKQSGITLIALIITIIVLLILAAVSIGMLSGENGLITKSQTAVRVYNESEVLEEIQHKILELQIDMQIAKAENRIEGNQVATLEDLLRKLQAEGTVWEVYEIKQTASLIGDFATSIPENGTLSAIFIIYKGYQLEVSSSLTVKSLGKVGSSYQQEDIPTPTPEPTQVAVVTPTPTPTPVSITVGETATGGNKEYTDGTNTAIIPEGFTVSGVDGKVVAGTKDETTIETGLVIYDIPAADLTDTTKVNWSTAQGIEKIRTTYNQWVWIPVDYSTATNEDKASGMYKTNGENGTTGWNVVYGSGANDYVNTKKASSNGPISQTRGNPRSNIRIQRAGYIK